MDWINRLNSAINYMEEHIKNEIDMEEVGKIAGCSSYHFQRMFTYMAILRCRNIFAEGECHLRQLICFQVKR